MKIAMLTTSFPLREGHTSGTFVYDLARALVGEGHEVRVLAPHAHGAARREPMSGIEVRRFLYALPSSLEVLAYEAGIPANLKRRRWAKLLLPQFAAADVMSTLATCRGCDVIHAHWTFSGIIGAWAKALWRIPLVITTHGSDINELPERGPQVALTRWALRRADRVICVSEALAGKVIELGVPCKRVTVIHNGVDTDKFHPGPPRPRGHRLLWVGRLSPEKGLKYLIEALPLVRERVPDVHLTLVGEGSQEEALRSQAEALGVADAISFAGPRPHDDIPELMRQADLFVLPSLNEGFGIVLIEAMASGLPIVASDTGGIPEIVEHGRTGVLVPPGESDSLAWAIMEVLRDGARTTEMVEGALAEVHKRFSSAAQVRAYERVYGELVGAPVAESVVAVGAASSRGGAK